MKRKPRHHDCFDGTLQNLSFDISRSPSHRYPRSFGFDPTGQVFYCCNQRADHVTLFEVNRKTSGLKFTGQYTPVGNPSCIVFLDLAKKN